MLSRRVEFLRDEQEPTTSSQARTTCLPEDAPEGRRCPLALPLLAPIIEPCIASSRFCWLLLYCSRPAGRWRRPIASTRTRPSRRGTSGITTTCTSPPTARRSPAVAWRLTMTASSIMQVNQRLRRHCWIPSLLTLRWPSTPAARSSAHPRQPGNLTGLSGFVSPSRRDGLSNAARLVESSVPTMRFDENSSMAAWAGGAIAQPHCRVGTAGGDRTNSSHSRPSTRARRGAQPGTVVRPARS